MRNQRTKIQKTKVNSLETELKAHKKLFKDVVGKLVKQVKAMEVKLKTKKRKVVVTVTVDSTKSPGGASSNPDACSYDPTSDVPTTDVPSGVAPTSPSTISPGSTIIPTSSSIPAAEPIPARSGTTTATPSSLVKDARKGKGCYLEKHKSELFFMKDANLARQMSQDFEMTTDQRKRQQEVLASAANYSDATWDIILARLQANPDLSSTIFRVDFMMDRFYKPVVALVQFLKKNLLSNGVKKRRIRPMAPAQLGNIWELMGLKRDGSPMTTAFSKKLKTGDVECDVFNAGSFSGVPLLHVEVEDPSQECSRGERSTVEDVEVSFYNCFSSTIKLASQLRSYAYGVIMIDMPSTGLETSQVFTSLRKILHLVTRADLMMIYGHVMTFYQDKKAEGVGLALWGDLKILMDSPEVNDGKIVSGLVIHMFVDKKYPLTLNLIERMLDHQLEICHGTVGNQLTTAVQLIAFLKKQIFDSKRPKVHEWVINSPCYHNKELLSLGKRLQLDWLLIHQAEVVPKSVAGSSFPAASSTLLPFDVQICAEVSCVQVKTQADWMLLYVVPTGRVVVPTGRYVVPAGKVIIIVSPGRLSLVPTGRILSPGRVK
ncbi:hypothetical protein Tco_0641130 [Tanacetum coccineum]